VGYGSQKLAVFRRRASPAPRRTLERHGRALERHGRAPRAGIPERHGDFTAGFTAVHRFRQRHLALALGRFDPEREDGAGLTK
jgi:hypothetical protein